jgi:AAA domain
MNEQANSNPSGVPPALDDADVPPEDSVEWNAPMSDDEIRSMGYTHKDATGRWVKLPLEREPFNPGPDYAHVEERGNGVRARISQHFVGLTPELKARIREQLGREDDDDVLDESWRRVDLGPALRGEITKPAPSILRRDDGAGCFTAGCVNGIHGGDGDGKSMVAALATTQEILDGHDVIWVDFEEPNEATLLERLRDVFGLDPDTIDRQLHYYGPREPFDKLAVAAIKRDVAEHDVTLIVVDSLGEAFGLEGVDEDRDKDVAPWMRRVARTLADAGPAVLNIDHATKAADNPLHPSGSKRKRAAITGQSYLLEAPQPLTRENGGRVTLKCAKDRHGHYRRGTLVAGVEFNIYPDGTVVHVRAPAERQRDADAPSAKLDLMERKAVEAVTREGQSLSQNRLEELMNVKASAKAKRAGMEQAVARGTLRITAGPRKSILYSIPEDET